MIIKFDEFDIVNHSYMQGEWEKHIKNVLIFFSIHDDDSNIIVFKTAV